MKFFSKWSEDRPRPKSEPGEEIITEYHLVIDEYGNEELEPCGTTDLHASIQSHAASVDLNLILDRYRNGDETAIDKVQGFYADVSALPLKFQDLMNMNMQGKQFFDSLPKEQRALYGNNYIQFLDNPQVLIDYLNKESSADKKENNQDLNNAKADSKQTEEVKPDDKQE